MRNVRVRKKRLERHEKRGEKIRKEKISTKQERRNIRSAREKNKKMKVGEEGRKGEYRRSVWEIVNRDRKKWKEIDKNIEKWRNGGIILWFCLEG